MIREQNLEEWFSQYQLAALARRHFYIPYDMEIDITTLCNAYAAQGARPPLTAIVVKAAGMVARERPELNRVVLATPFGTRVVQFAEAHVNLPVMLEHAGEEHLSATVVRHADTLSVPAIVEEIQRAKARKLADLPIGRHFIENRNTAFNRFKLRLRHAGAYAVPALYARYGGGISVTSLVRPQKPGVLLRAPGYGPTAVTIAPGAVRTESDGRTTLFMAVGYDHYALPGMQAIRALERMGELLVEGDAKHFGPLTEALSSSTTPLAYSTARA